MKKGKITVIIIIIVIFTLGYSYHWFTCNEITDTYDWITLRNIYSTLDDLVITYEKQYNNQNVDENGIKDNLIFKEYFHQMNTYEWYLSLSPRLNDVKSYIGKISDIDDDGISEKELEYLINVRAKLKIYLDKINEELDEVSIRRIFGIFRKSNVDELQSIFNETSN
nr:hypothetical protein [Sedimentibacter sp.]